MQAFIFYVSITLIPAPKVIRFMNPRVAIIDYGMGNVFSVKNALDAIKTQNLISNDPNAINDATHIVLPGVGAFAKGMDSLRSLNLISVLEEEVRLKKKPFLGICLGMQFLSTQSNEHGLHPGLGWVGGQVKRLERDEKKYPIPHMGWNDVAPSEGSVLFEGISNPVFYFVHSYYFDVLDKNNLAATSDYGGEFAAAVQKDNIFGVQFHPEKSQKSGLQVLNNFLSYNSEHA